MRAPLYIDLYWYILRHVVQVPSGGGKEKIQRKKQLTAFELGQEVEEILTAFCTAHHNASKVEVVRRALQQFIETDLAENPGVRRAFEELRKKSSRGPAEVFAHKPRRPELAGRTSDDSEQPEPS